MSGQQSKSCQQLVTLSALILVVSALLLTTTNPIDARYLPTRADDTDVEVLKDLIRELIAQSNMDQMIESRLNRLQSSNPMAGERYIIPVHMSSQRTHQIERRSEIPQGSAGDNLLRGV